MNSFIQIFSTLIVIAAQTLTNASGTVNFLSTDQSNPDLDCLFFGNIGCHATCALIGKLYVQGGEGTCDINFTCVCSLYQSVSPDDLWNSKFVKNAESDSFLNQIKTNRQIQDIAFPLLKDPLQSGTVVKNHLIASFPENQNVKLLEPKTDQLLTRIITDPNNFNAEVHKLVDFVKTELSKIPQDLVNHLISDNYKERIQKFANDVNNPFTLEHVLKQLKRIPHDFSTRVKDYLKNKFGLTDNKHHEPETSTQQILKTIADTVVNELMSIVDKAGLSSPNSTSAETMVSIHEDEYGNIVREWRNQNSHIRYFKDKRGDESLHWRVDNTLVHLYRENDKQGNVYQEWCFGEVIIRLNNYKEGIIEHTWDFGKTQYFYRKSKEGIVNEGWTHDADLHTLTTYKDYIKSWCAQNTELFPNKCVIFDY